MSKLQKYAALIHAWADGAEIEVLSTTGNWRHVPHPKRDESTYRIKPQTQLDIAIEARERIYEIGAQSRVLAISEAALNKIRSME